MRSSLLIVLLSLPLLPGHAAPYPVLYATHQSISVTDHQLNLVDMHNFTREMSDASPTTDGNFPGIMNIQDNFLYFKNYINNSIAKYDLEKKTIETLPAPDLPVRDIYVTYFDSGAVYIEPNHDNIQVHWNQSTISRTIFSSVIHHYDGTIDTTNYTLGDLAAPALIDYINQFHNVEFWSVAEKNRGLVYGNQLWEHGSISFASSVNSSLEGTEFLININLDTGEIIHRYYLRSNYNFTITDPRTSLLNCGNLGGWLYNQELRTFMNYGYKDYCFINQATDTAVFGTFPTPLGIDPIYYFNETHYIQESYQDISLKIFSFTTNETSIIPNPYSTLHTWPIANEKYFAFLTVDRYVEKTQGGASFIGYNPLQVLFVSCMALVVLNYLKKYPRHL